MTDTPDVDPASHKDCDNEMCKMYGELYEEMREFASKRGVGPGKLVALLTALIGYIGDIAEIPRADLALAVMEAPGAGKSRVVQVGSGDILNIIKEIVGDEPPKPRNPADKPN